LGNPYRLEFMPHRAAAAHIAEFARKANAVSQLLTKV